MNAMLDILNFAEAGLRVLARPDIGGVEIQVREGDNVTAAVVLGPLQAVALSKRLVEMARAVAETG